MKKTVFRSHLAAALRTKTLWAIALFAMSTCVFVACSDDDDDSSSGSAYGSETAGQVTGTDGITYLVASADDVYFDYDSDGTLVGIDAAELSDLYFEVSYAPFTITGTYGYSDDEEELNLSQTWSDIAVNSNGYITSMKLTEEETYSDSYYDESGEGSLTLTFSFSYDSDGHLTRVSASGSSSGKETYEGETWSFSGTFSASGSYTWNDNLLTEVSYTETSKEQEGGETYTGTEEGTFAYDYTEDYPNATYQYTPSLLSCTVYIYDEEGVLSGLHYLGYFGKGPVYHPTTYTENVVYKDYYDGELDEEDDFDESLTMKYDLNANGTVGTYYCCDTGSSWWDSSEYTYVQLGDTGIKTRASVQETDKVDQRSHRSIAKRLLRSHRYWERHATR